MRKNENLLTAKREDYLIRLKEGNNKDYRMIVYAEDAWFYIDGTTTEPEPILTLHILTDDTFGVSANYSFSFADEPSANEGALSPIVLNLAAKELVVEDHNGLYAFGVKDVTPPARSALIYFRTSTRHGIIFAQQDIVNVNIFYDDISNIVDDLATAE